MVKSVVLLLLMQARAGDPVRTFEAAEMLLKAQTLAQSRHAPPKAEARRRQFEQKFNALVAAMEAFSRKYNEGKGELWPEREANAVRKALKDLQQGELGPAGNATRETKHEEKSPYSLHR